MARYKAFDRDKVLDKALDLFWHKGYEATSIQDLVSHLGIGRGSLYDTFGSKHELYLAALDRYQQSASLFKSLNQSGPALEAIEQVFDRLIEHTLTDNSQRGCFLINSTVELAPHDQHTAARAKAGFNDNEEAFYQVLVRAQADNEISQTKDPRALARFLVNSIRGLRVMAKINPDPQALADVVRVTLSALH